MTVSFEDKSKADRYWQENIKLVITLLVIWATVSFGCGILLVDVLNEFTFMGFKLGFWFAQQGAIYTFVLLIFVYAAKTNKLDEKYGVHED
ncbi:MAG: putative solute:sodium symporter small subunit [Psychromonas sp.]|jgi:putative solute:sodium symporter small subunit